MSETRDLSLGSKGERDWRSLRNAYLLGPEKGCSLLISDSGEVRSEVRRRMQSLAPATVRLEPARDVLAKIHEAAKLAEPDKPPLVWIEARDSADPQRAWADALQALNRGRDLVWDAGPVYVVLAGDSWMHRRLREGAPDLSSTINPVVMLAAHVELLGEPTEPLCWLHLSDVHVSSGDWQLDTVLEALIRDLPGLLAAAERKPQLLFVTGDIANRASPAEYDGAFDFFETLAKRVGIDSRHIFMVPGNHDVDRSAITKAVQRSEMMFDSLAEKNENEFRTAIGEIVGDPQEMRRYGARLAAWCQFTGRFLGVARQVSIDQPWRSDIVPVAGVLVGVASICSVWLSGPNERRGTLVVGELQVRQLVKELEAGGAQLRVALLHHPLDWLREADAKALRTLLRNEFDVVLHGHTHDPQAGAFVHGQRDTVEIGGGATYAGIGNDRFHGFSVGQLEPTASQGQVVIDAFTWTTRSGGHWHLDAGFHRDAPQGRMTLPLRLARLGAAAGAKGPPQPDALAGRLRRAALRVHAAQAFIGLPDSAPRPQASLHDMFVPLELRRRGPEPQAAVELATVQAAWLGGGAAPVRAVILGDPGSGKSTLCRYLVVSAAELEGGPVPILLTVRDWAVEGAREGILELALRHVERDLEIRTDLATLTAMCRAGRVLIAIDGGRRNWPARAGAIARPPACVRGRIPAGRSDRDQPNPRLRRRAARRRSLRAFRARALRRVALARSHRSVVCGRGAAQSERAPAPTGRALGRVGRRTARDGVGPQSAARDVDRDGSFSSRAVAWGSGSALCAVHRADDRDLARGVWAEAGRARGVCPDADARGARARDAVAAARIRVW